jgi:4-hydroxy-3-methylbut-2-en-1-yl diphosphate reductase
VTSESERLLLAAPMRIEARLIASGARSAHVHRTGIGPRRATQAAKALAELPGGALIVLGFCGALQRGLQPGEVVVAERVYAAADEGHGELDLACAGAGKLAAALAEAGFSTRTAPIVSVGRLALGERREQLRREGAAAVDMESVWLAGGARTRPFAVVRVVLDTPERELLRPRMLPLALRAGAALRRAAAAIERLAMQQRLHRLLAGGVSPVGDTPSAGDASSAGGVPAEAGNPSYGGESKV